MRRFVILLFSIIFAFTSIVFILFNFIIYPRKYESIVNIYSSEFEVDSALVFAVIKAESNFDPSAISSAGAVGLMQLLPSTAKWIAYEFNEEYLEENLFVPEINIKYGCFYLSYLTKKFNSIIEVICAYNAGEGVVRNWLREYGKITADNIPYPETKAYYEKIVRYRAAYGEIVLAS